MKYYHQVSGKQTPLFMHRLAVVDNDELERCINLINCMT